MLAKLVKPGVSAAGHGLNADEWVEKGTEKQITAIAKLSHNTEHLLPHCASLLLVCWSSAKD